MGEKSCFNILNSNLILFQCVVCQLLSSGDLLEDCSKKYGVVVILFVWVSVCLFVYSKSKAKWIDGPQDRNPKKVDECAKWKIVPRKSC